METSPSQFAEGTDKPQQSDLPVKQQQQRQQSQSTQLPFQPFGQPQQRSTSPFPSLNITGTTLFDWVAAAEGNTVSPSTNADEVMGISQTDINSSHHKGTLSLLPDTVTWANSKSNSKSKPRPPSIDTGLAVCTDTKSPASTNDTTRSTNTATPTYYNPQQYQLMDPKHQSLFFLQTAAEQEAVNNAIERENAAMHQHLIDMAQSKSVNALGEDMEEARQKLHKERREEQAKQREELAKENAKMKIKLAQMQWGRPEPILSPAVEARLQDFEQERLEVVEQKRQYEDQVAKENARLRIKLEQAQWKQPTHLDATVEQRRKELREERRRSIEDRKQKNQILAKENARLQHRLSRVQGKLSSHLDTSVEQRRLDLVEERRKSLEQLREAQTRQAKSIISPRENSTRITNKSPTSMSLDNSVEQRRRELEHERRQKAERKRQELRAHTKAMKERLNKVKGREQKSLDKATKSKRIELQEKRAKEKFKQEQERKKHSAKFRKRMSTFLESDEYHDNSPAATIGRFSFDHDEQRRLHKQRQQEKLQKKKQELATHKKEFLKRTRGIKRGRTILSLDAEVEALRKDLAQKSISDNQERTEKIRKQNMEFHTRVKNVKARHSISNLDTSVQEARSQSAWKLQLEASKRRKTLAAENAKMKKRLSDVAGRETKSLIGVVRSLQSEREQARKKAVMQKHKELMQHQKTYKKRLSDVTSRDCMKLDKATQAVRSQRNAKRNSTIRQRQKELAKNKARLQEMVDNVKSPIQQMLSTNFSPPFSSSKVRSDTFVTPSPVSFGTEITTTTTNNNNTNNNSGSFQSPQPQLSEIPLFDFQNLSNFTTPESLILKAAKATSSSSSEKKRLGQKRIVEACHRNQQLRDHNLKLRKRLSEAAAASIQKLESTITP
ncbi:MAG: hypothetical protein SGBAC_004100 [Bacillariaceae sp.]